MIASLHFCVRLADRTDLIRFGDGDLCIVDRFCRRFLPESDDVARFVGDVRHVDVDEAEADFFQLALDVAGDRLQKLVAVGVDLLDVHGGDDQAQLAEDDVLGELLDLVHFEVAQPFRRILHDGGLGGDADREDRRNVDADILPREGALQVYRNGQRRQIEVGKRLHERPDERRAAVDTLGAAGVARLIRADFTVDDHDFIGRALFVAGRDHKKQHDEHEHHNDDEYDDPGLHTILSLSEFLFTKFVLSC